MAGLSADAAHFFKFLFVLVLYTLAMTLFVRVFVVDTCLAFLTDQFAELPSCDALPQWRHRHSHLGSDGVIPDDLRWLLCPPEFHSAGATMVAMVVSPKGEILPRAQGFVYSCPTPT